MDYKRNCPKCGKVIEYSCYKSLWRGTHTNAKCASCKLLGRVITQEWKDRISASKKGQKPWCTGKKLSKNHRRSMSDAAKLRFSKPEEREKQRARLIGKRFGKRPVWWCNRISQSKMGHETSIETRRKIAKTVREFRLGKVTPCYNPNACILIEEYGKKHGFNFQHAENGGEVRVIGYSLDGYDKEKNVVIEVDEPSHRWKVEYDARRQKEIEEHLGCKFIRLKTKE